MEDSPPDRLFQMTTQPLTIESPALRGGELERDDRGIWCRRVAMHSADKAYYVRRYLDIVAKGMRHHWPGKLWVVELFAGPGRLLNVETGQYLNGSPLDALGLERPFDGHVFIDLDARCVESLRRLVGGRAEVTVLEGNANAADLHDRIAAIVPRDALVVMYADPEGLDLEFQTLRYFSDRYPHLDLLLNFPVAGVVRALAAGHESKAGRVLEHPSPLSLVRGGGGGHGPSVREFFERQLRGLGYGHFDTKVIENRNNADLYDLMIASRHDRATDFFRKAISIEPPGQYQLDLGV